MKVRTRAAAAIAAATMAALIGASAPAYASVRTRAVPAADSARAVPAEMGWIQANAYNNTRQGNFMCQAGGAALKAAGQASDWYCEVDPEDSNILYLWIYTRIIV